MGGKVLEAVFCQHSQASGDHVLFSIQKKKRRNENVTSKTGCRAEDDEQDLSIIFASLRAF